MNGVVFGAAGGMPLRVIILTGVAVFYLILTLTGVVYAMTPSRVSLS